VLFRSAFLQATDLNGALLINPRRVTSGESIHIPLQQAGEILVYLKPVDPNEPANDYALAVNCSQGCNTAYTRYPTVLFHGFGGAESFGDLAYFNGVREALEPQGYALHSPSVSPFATTEARALEWELHLESLLEQGLGRRFNLIGHSQGGLDARYLVGGLGRADLVASVITVGTPHYGTPIADLLYGAVDSGLVDAFWVDLGTEAFVQIFGLVGDENSLVDAMGAFTTETLAEFNSTVPDHPDVYYASWAGVTCGALDFSCQAACGGEIVDPLLAIFNLILDDFGDRNDGMLLAESAVWGDYQGAICADHADQVGLFGGTTGGSFNHLDFYHDELERLTELGL
jgi:triacylglycerol lipase